MYKRYFVLSYKHIPAKSMLHNVVKINIKCFTNLKLLKISNLYFSDAGKLLAVQMPCNNSELVKFLIK